jgi:hypothetical protein
MIEPFPFQRDLVQKLGNPEIRGRLIGDEPGLGLPQDLRGYLDRSAAASALQSGRSLASTEDAYAGHSPLVGS